MNFADYQEAFVLVMRDPILWIIAFTLSAGVLSAMSQPALAMARYWASKSR